VQGVARTDRTIARLNSPAIENFRPARRLARTSRALPGCGERLRRQSRLARAGGAAHRAGQRSRVAATRRIWSQPAARGGAHYRGAEVGCTSISVGSALTSAPGCRLGCASGPLWGAIGQVHFRRGRSRGQLERCPGGLAHGVGSREDLSRGHRTSSHSLITPSLRARASIWSRQRGSLRRHHSGPQRFGSRSNQVRAVAARRQQPGMPASTVRPIPGTRWSGASPPAARAP